jgi:hypothetical protein
MDMTLIAETTVAALVGLLAVYGAFHVCVKTIGGLIPGKDKVELFGEKLDSSFAPIIAAIEKGVDLLNPKTNGGAGLAPKVRKATKP